MTAKEFTKKCISGGYACIRQVKEYIKKHEKMEYTEEDIESIFRLYEPKYWADEKYTSICGTKTTKRYGHWE